ncbi:LysR family transcriptional regulator [Paraburkholderia sp. DHOC27]|uniref:LysR family transcriptional regulator n=1 Tax=Paraburkholderia sp. DHOC27 TaxID=2303330 RepID=UPI0015F32AE3|nr:LysR family transcriptional regulator [Paraburkholderia sp. DHOC27]
MQIIKCLELFKAVAEHKSFSRAALANNLAPGAVTRAVQELEAELGVRLLHRTTRKLSVTDVGMTVYNRAVLLLDSFTEIKEIGEASSRTMSGTVRVAIQRLLGFDALSSVLDGYMQSHTNITVDVDFFADGDDPLGCGADIAISLQPEVRDVYIARQISSLSMSLFAGVRFSANTNAGSPADLLPEERMSVGGTSWDLLAEGSGKRLHLPCGSRFRSSSPEAIAVAAVQGFGIALLPPDAAKPYVEAGQLFSLFDGWHSASVPVAISYRSRQFVPERVRSLISYISENIDRRDVDGSTLAEVACKRPMRKDDIAQLLALDA